MLPWPARDGELVMRPVTLVLLATLSGAVEKGAVVPGAPDRIEQVFDERGGLVSQTAYREGRKAGRHVSYWPGGARRIEAFYDGDRIVGEYRSWHANGRLAERKRYEQGHESGMQQAWTEEGELFLNFEVRNGRHYGLVNSRPCSPVKGEM